MRMGSGLRVRSRRMMHRLKYQWREMVEPSRDWSKEPGEVPWFDRPDALAYIERWRKSGRINAETSGLLEKWVRDGYLILDDVVPLSDLDAVFEPLDALWEAARPIAGLNIWGLKRPGGTAVFDLSHEALLKIDLAERRRIKADSDWRLHGYHQYNAAAMRVFLNPYLPTLCSFLFDREAHPFFSINFMHGSQQTLHEDMAVFHVYPRNFLVGAWIAGEDVSPEAGPLIYYPGSHRAPMYPKFANYPQTNLRTANEATTLDYQTQYIPQRTAVFEKRIFLAKKGQVFLWHGMLIHGGEKIQRRGLTRKSMVIHYLGNGCERSREVHGPFNW
jgi:phytanoyl-CoA hydroxylase